MKKPLFLTAVLGIILHVTSFAQSIKLNNQNDPGSAMLEVNSASKGILIPNVSLTGSTDATTIASPAVSLLVYNTVTVSDVQPGYYYNSGTPGSPVWSRLSTGSSSQIGANTTNYLSKWNGAALVSSQVFDNGTNIGIGTASPLMKLHVNYAGDSILLLENTRSLGIDVKTSMYFKTGFGYTGGIKTIGTNPVDARLGLFTSASSNPNNLQERMSILDNGNVGIGKTNPETKLHVEGNVKVAGIISGVTNPVNPQDAATKAYVDLLDTKLEALEGVKDIDNNRYDIITIGTQTWMAENLKTTRYNDGTLIPLITDNTLWGNASTNASPGYSWYNAPNESSNLIAYGALYNWYAINTTANGNKNVCPTGWHVPTDVEWTTLTTNLGGESVAGVKMKEAGLAHWLSPNTGATNESGFTGLPGGYRYNSGTFYLIGGSGLWWSSKGYDATNAWIRGLGSGNGDVFRGDGIKGSGFSVRCLRD